MAASNPKPRQKKQSVQVTTLINTSNPDFDGVVADSRHNFVLVILEAIATEAIASDQVTVTAAFHPVDAQARGFLGT